MKAIVQVVQITDVCMEAQVVNMPVPELLNNVERIVKRIVGCPASQNQEQSVEGVEDIPQEVVLFRTNSRSWTSHCHEDTVKVIHTHSTRAHFSALLSPSWRKS